MTSRLLEPGDRPLLWRHLPAPIRALGKRLRWLMDFGDFPKARRLHRGASACWSTREVTAWSAKHADWLETESKRWAVLDAVETWDPSGEGVPS